MLRIKNKQARDRWIADVLSGIGEGESLLDVGAGECDYKVHCGHLKYVSQDVALYDGTGEEGIHTKSWDTSRIDIVCDLYDIPEDEAYDNVLCTEVLEHVVDPVAAVEKMARLVKPGGAMILTAPFTSMTHFAPYHYCTGFSRYFYEHHLPRLGFEIEALVPNGGYFDFMDQELGRVRKVRKRHSGWPLDPVSFIVFLIARMNVRLLAHLDGPRMDRKSAQFMTYGWHVVARKTDG